MKGKWKKIGCIGFLFYILFLNFAIIGFAAKGSVIIGDDPEKDLRLFDNEWLVDEFDDTEWDDLDEDLDEVYTSLDRNWDNTKACEPLYDNTGDEYNNPENYRKYSKYTYVDILQIRVEDLDTTKAKMVVEVNGDAKDSDRVWFLFLWSDCSGDTDDIVFIGVFIPSGIGGDDLYYYEWEQENDNGNGTIDFENEGHNIEMDFDSENWNNVKECEIRAILMTTKNEVYTNFQDEDMVIDIFPGKYSALNEWWWLWLLLLIIIIIIVAVVLLYYYYYKKKQNKTVSNINGGGRKSYRKWSLAL